VLVNLNDDLWIAFFGLLTLGANIAVLALAVLAIGARLSRRPGRLTQWWGDVRASLGESGIALGAVVALTATVGSLYLSEGAHFTPCLLCWYQRAAMYPLALILLVAAVRRDWHVRPYALALALVGPVVSVYHYLIERRPGLEIGGSCSAVGPPCSARYIEDMFGYVSIPFMALSAFALVATLLVVARPVPGDAGAHANMGPSGASGAGDEVAT
jgi:disulfide bond formation protein DsbB